MSQKPTLIYFPSRGRAELIRLVLAEAGVDYDEHPVLPGASPQGGRPTDFKELKASGELPFEAVPVWIEPDGFRLAQSHAIALHLARGHGLLPEDRRARARVDELLAACDDVRLEIRKLIPAEPAKRPAIRQELLESFLPRWMGFLDRHLGDRSFVAGEQLSVADLALFYLLELLRDNGLDAPVQRHPRLLALVERVAARPRLKAYLASARRPPFTPMPS